MGQQQLLLVVLVTIIIGIATVVAINTMQAATDEANADPIRQEILQAHANSNSFLRRPAIIGGGEGSYDGITLESIQLPELSENAAYSLGEVNSDSFQIIAESDRGFTLKATITKGSSDIEWEKN
ncbi:MAG: hypothetical protein JJU46_01710 [Balneolaceae bacterium]|nr:hypothetical protein [Balneolaceae bacterium]MCH8550279.1 hypothetical protein [Balneolaceae bacterium]